MLHWGETLLTFMGRFHSCRCPCVCYLWLDLITYKKAFVWAVFRQGKRFPLLYTWNQHNNCKSIIRQYKIKSERGKKITKSAFALGGPVDKIVFPLQGVRVWSSVRELRSHLPQAMTKKKKKKERENWINILIKVLLASLINYQASQLTLVVKNLPANAGRLKRCGFDPWVRKIPWRMK